MLSKLITMRWQIIVVALAAAIPAACASAANVYSGLSARETYIGLPVTLQVRVANASHVDAPTIPDIDGVTVKPLGTPARSTQITSINGRTTATSTTTYEFELTPERAGSFQIPPITVHADGENLQTRALDFVASKGETGDRVFVEIAGKEKQIYVGQSLDLTLKIWLRPFRDGERKITLSEGNMWTMISERTNWGAFSDRMQQIADQGKRPVGHEVIRTDQSGVEHSYYLYEIENTIYPKRPGKIDAGDVKIIVNYPTALGKARDPFSGFFDTTPFPRGPNGLFDDDDFPSPFGSQLTVKSFKPIIASAVFDPVEILPIPSAGRPADYRGAVGKYVIATEATPTDVKAGDPINLLIGISGTGPMDLIQAPPLADVPALAADFKVPNEPLAGFVKGDRKVFSTSIRPRKEGVTRVPAIPYSFFDPAAKKFVTVHSDPIEIHVGPADTLVLDKAIQHGASQAGAQPEKTGSTAAASPELAVFSGDDVLRTDTPGTLTFKHLATLLALPPLLVLGLVLFRWRHGVLAFPRIFRTGVRAYARRIEKATTGVEVVAILKAFVAKRLGIKTTFSDTASVIGLLRAAGYRELAIRCERLFELAERADFEDGEQSGSQRLERLKRAAQSIVDDLHAQSLEKRPQPRTSLRPDRRSPLRKATSQGLRTTIVIGVLIASANRAFAAEAAAGLTPQESAPTSATVQLTAEQQRILLAEAVEQYHKAQSVATKDSADAKQAFADAAEKFETVRRSGVSSAPLFLNLGNAYLQSGQTGRALANYRRALRVDPTNNIAQKNLTYAETLVTPAKKGAQHPSAEAAFNSQSVAAAGGVINDWLNRSVGPRTVVAIMVIAWIILWTAIALRIFAIQFPWKSTATVAALFFAIACASHILTSQQLSRTSAVVVKNDAALHEGDGPSFPVVSDGHLREGQTLELLKRRGDWFETRTEDGEVGWLPSAAVEVI